MDDRGRGSEGVVVRGAVDDGEVDGGEGAVDGVRG